MKMKNKIQTRRMMLMICLINQILLNGMKIMMKNVGFFLSFFFKRIYYKGQENYVDKLSAWFVSPLFFMVNEP